MSQYQEQVEYQKLRLAAEKWADGIQCIHSHQLKSMWYDDRPQDTDDGPVMDIQFNDGRIKRTIIKSGEVIWMNGSKQLTGEDLVYEYNRNNPGS
tara:strand:- start:621 stop:905 length:285 start_codon:yes stop_codon:yes gene_type:complete